MRASIADRLTNHLLIPLSEQSSLQQPSSTQPPLAPLGTGVGGEGLEAAMTAEKRLVQVTAAYLKHNHLDVTGLRDFVPPEAVGGPRCNKANGHGAEVARAGLGDTL